MSPVVKSLPPELRLLHGAHETPEDGFCVMEAVAFVAGEPHSDTPECACPVIGAFMRSWNDGIPATDSGAELRTRLLAPYIEKLVGSKSTPAVEQRRADLALDWLVRVQTSAWLDLSPTTAPAAARLRALAPLVTPDAVAACLPIVREAQQDAAAAWAAAWAAARAAARDAARAAAWAAAWDAARDAAWAAARAAARDAAWAAARDAAWDTARDAARAAARAAAWDTAWDAGYEGTYAAVTAVLAPTRDRLQQSALELLDRMLAVTMESLDGKESGDGEVE